MDESKNFERNRRVVQALKDAGADFKKEHAIEHHIYCYTESDFNQIVTLGNENGYTVANDGQYEDDEGVYWQLDLIYKSTPDIASIEKQSIEIEHIVESSNADYDGWGTEVKK